MKRQVILDIITALFLLLFAYTGLSKLLTPHIMMIDLMKPEQPRILYNLRYVLPYLIPISELVVAGLLLTSKYRKTGFLGSLILMSIFTLYVGYILFFFHGLQRPCTCGGIFRFLSWDTHFFINLFYTTLAVIGLALERKKLQGIQQPNVGSISYKISH